MCRAVTAALITIMFSLAWSLAGAIEPVPASKKYAVGSLIIASQHLQDPVFGQTVILILNQGRTGTYGVVINRKSSIKAEDVLPTTHWTEFPPDVYTGGPVSQKALRILVRSELTLAEGKQITSDLWHLETHDELALYVKELSDRTPSLLYLGYAGWLPGQLEAEIQRGDWIIRTITSKHLFDTDPEQLWQQFRQESQQIWTHKPLPGRTKFIPGIDRQVDSETACTLMTCIDNSDNFLSLTGLYVN